MLQPLLPVVAPVVFVPVEPALSLLVGGVGEDVGVSVGVADGVVPLATPASVVDRLIVFPPVPLRSLALACEYPSGALQVLLAVPVPTPA